MRNNSRTVSVVYGSIYIYVRLCASEDDGFWLNWGNWRKKVCEMDQFVGITFWSEIWRLIVRKKLFLEDRKEWLFYVSERSFNGILGVRSWSSICLRLYNMVHIIFVFFGETIFDNFEREFISRITSKHVIHSLCFSFEKIVER